MAKNNQHQASASISNNNNGANTQNQNTVQDPTQNPSSPYFVHPNETPSISMVSEILTGPNYYTWARSMRRAMIGKNKFGFLNGTITPPDQFHPLYPAWERCNNLIHTWLMNSLSPAIKKSVDAIENVGDIWRILRERFSQGDLTRIGRLQHELYALQQGALSVSAYFTELSGLWEELDCYRPVYTCACQVRCSCVAARNPPIHREQDYIIRFLTGLNDEYENARSQILMMEPVPSLNKVFSMIL